MNTPELPPIIVSSCDGYSDCWEPFFRLFSEFWPDCPHPILLISERRDLEISHQPRLNIRVVKTARVGEKRVAWADCWKRVLDAVPDDRFIYLQEDYFLSGPVRGEYIEKALDLHRDLDCAHFGLTTFGARGPFRELADRDWAVQPLRRSRYRINLQAGIWKKDVFQAYLQPGESAWDFEHLGALRVRFRDDLFLTLKREAFRAQPVFPYTGTGIIRGQWHPEMPEQFFAHGINVDFAKRGIYQKPPYFQQKLSSLIDRLRLSKQFFRVFLSEMNRRPSKPNRLN